MKRVCWVLFIAGLCHSASKALECTTRGRFPNEDPECRGYTMCLFAGPGGFMQYNITCPVGFVYTHLEQQCTNSTTYKCQPDYVCNTTGTFENPFTSNCTSFVACVDGINGIVTARRIDCPIGNIFDPNEGYCTNSTEYMCIVDDLSNLVVNSTVLPLDAAVEVSASVNGAIKVCAARLLFFVGVILVCLYWY